MTETTDNLVIRLLQEMRSEAQETLAEMKEMRRENAVQFEELRAQIGVVAQGQNSIRQELKLVREQIQEIAIVVDHHSMRLDAIDHHLGLNQSKH